MARTDNEQIGLYHGYLNTCYSYLQDWYTYLNIKTQLTPTEDMVELMLFRRLWQGECLDMTNEENGYVRFLLHLKNSALHRYEHAPAHILKLITRKQGDYDYADVVELAGFYAGHAYSRDNYIRGLIKYGEVYNIPEVADRWRQQLRSTSQDIQVAKQFFATLQQQVEPLEQIMTALQQDSILLPGIFGCKSVDIQHIEGMRSGHFDFDSLGIEADDKGQWLQHGFDPLNAGYWSAYGFDAESAIDWIRGGLPYPGWAAGFFFRGIDCMEACEWNDLGVAPPEAEKLRNSGTSPKNYRERMATLS